MISFLLHNFKEMSLQATYSPLQPRFESFGYEECSLVVLKTKLCLGRVDCHRAVIDEFLCMVAGCALVTDVYMSLDV